MSDRYVTVAGAAAVLTFGATACAALAIGGLLGAANKVVGRRRPELSEMRRK